MACDCDQYIDCGDTGMEIGTYDDAAEYKHQVVHAVTLDTPMEFSQKTTRTFTVNHGWDRQVAVTHILSGCDDPPRIACDNALEANASSSCSEHCVREINVPWYWDQQRGIYVWKNVREELLFRINSTKTAAFRTKWGTSYFHKICIPNSVKTYGVERFVMVKDGVQKILAEVAYEYKPFPATEGGGATWGLYGNTVQRSATADTEDVACILCFPTVPKQAIPLDNDVIAYGFYDYNAIEGGFIESSLPKDDGGKDYFYPYWCRQMPVDPLWRITADQRYDVIYSAGKLDVSGISAWRASEPVAYPLPFGSFALDSKDNFIASCILQFGEHAESKGVVYNEAGMGDLFQALTKLGPSAADRFTVLYPVTPL